MRRARRRTTPPIFFPEKENGRCDRSKERRLHCQPFLEKFLCLPMLLPARGEAALQLLYDLVCSYYPLPLCPSCRSTA